MKSPPSSRALAVLILVLVSGVAAWTPSCPGQVAPGSEWQCRQLWTVDDGLPQNTFVSIVQTQDDYLWAGSLGGLLRFDGDSFSVFDVASNPELGSNRIRCLFVGSNGRLWIATDAGGVCQYDSGRFSHRPLEVHEREPIDEIVEDGNGTVWLRGENLWRCRNGLVGNVEVCADLGVGKLFSLAVDPSGTAWLVGADAILRMDEERQRYPQHNPSKISRVLFGAKENVWALCSDGLYRLSTDSVGLQAAEELGAVKDVRGGAEGVHWIASARGLFKLELPDGVGGHPFRKIDWGTEVGLRSVYEDLEGNLWAGTAGRGLALLQRMPFVKVAGQVGLPQRDIRRLDVDERGRLWVHYDDGDTYSWQPGTPARRIDPELGDSGQLDAMVAKGGALWVIRGKSLFRHSAGDTQQWLHGLRGRVTGLVMAPDRTLWLSAPGQLCHFDGAQFRIEPLGELRDPSSTPVVHVDPDGQLWAVTSTGIHRRTDGGFELHRAPEDMLRGELRALHRSGDQSFWIGTYGGGLVRFQDGEYSPIGRKHGLPDLAVSNIQEDDDGRFWLNTNRGVVCAAREDLHAVADGTSHRLHCRTFPTGEANGPSGVLDPKGTLWLPTLNGLARMFTKEVTENTIPPQVKIQSLVADGVGHDLGDPIVIPPGHGNLEFRFTAPSFRASDSVRFQWKLEGYDSDWRSADWLRRASYTNIEPGSYTFRVRAINEDRVESKSDATVQLELEPFFYQTIWFKTLMAIGLVLIGSGAHFLRLRAERRRNAVLQEEVNSRKMAERDLLESREKYRALARASDAILTCDEAGRVMFANRASESVFGGSRDRLIGQSIVALIPDLAGLLAGSAAKASEGDGSFRPGGSEFEAIRIDETRVPVDVSVAAFLAHDGTQRITAVVRDASDRKRHETERGALRERLEQTERLEALGRLAGGISHDFNNILTAICGSAELLDMESRQQLSSRGVGYVEDIRMCGERAAKLTKQLLAFSRQQVMKPEILDVGEVLTTLRPMLQRLIRADVELEFELSSEAGVVRADRSKLEQVVVNLVLNARDAIGETGTITVSTVREPAAKQVNGGMKAHVCISVRDTGVGIDEQNLPKVFEPFFTTKEAGRGTGLGLATVHGIVAQFGGEIDVSTHPGRGTTFRVHLPEAEGQVVSPPDPDQSDSRVAGRETVLICDDEASVGRVIHDMLEGAGYATLLATGPGEAVELATHYQGNIDLLVADVVMPGMTGPQLARKVREIRRDSRTLFVTGYSAELVERQGVVDEDAPLLQKPFSQTELLGKVRGLLDRSHGSQRPG